MMNISNWSNCSSSLLIAFEPIISYLTSILTKTDKKQTKQSAYDIKQKVLITVGEGNDGRWCLQGGINQNKGVN